MNAKLPARALLPLLPALSALALAACSTFGPDTPQAGPVIGEPGNPVFAEPLEKSGDQLAPRDLATLIFMRPGTGAPTSAKGDAPVNVYVNGRYLASLLPGGFVEHRNCGGAVPVAAVFDDARIRHLGQRGQEANVNIEAGKTYYFRVEPAEDKQAKVTQLTVDQVFLGEYRRQSHTVTRAPACLPAAAPVAAAAAPVAAVVGTPVLAAPVAAAAPALLATEPVRAPLEAWRAAWERGDYDAYLSYYAPDFKGALPSRAAWEQQRRARLNNEAKRITLERVKLSSTASQVTTDFRQSYQSKSYNDNGQKRLVWQPVNGELKIVSETFSGR